MDSAFQVKAGSSSKPVVSVYIPPAVGKRTLKARSKLVVTFYNSTVFQVRLSDLQTNRQLHLPTANAYHHEIYVKTRLCSLQEVHDKVKLLKEVVEITVENELIVDLSEPVKMDFHHDAVSVSVSASCLSAEVRSRRCVA